MAIDKEFVKKWVAALRSGKYKQVKERLTNGKGGYCCLGVACKLKSLPRFRYGLSYFYSSVAHNNDLLLPREIRQDIGLDEYFQTELSSMNDEGSSFKEIADYIERELLDEKEEKYP
jgi:hypothetical protein